MRSLKFIHVVHPSPRSSRLSRIAEREFIMIGVSGSERYWYDEVEDVFYQESTCNGPSTWAHARVTPDT